jgi:hypothetical protein
MRREKRAGAPKIVTTEGNEIRIQLLFSSAA